MSHNPVNPASDQAAHPQSDPAPDLDPHADLEGDDDDSEDLVSDRPSLVQAVLAMVRNLVAKIAHLGKQVVNAIAQRLPGVIDWLKTHLGTFAHKALAFLKKVPGAVSHGLKALILKAQQLKGGKQAAQAREEAALLAEATGDSEDESIPAAGSNRKFKLAIAGSCLVLLIAPFVARFRPGGSNSATVPPLALAGPVANGDKKPSESKEAEKSEPVAKNESKVDESKEDPFANDANAPPVPSSAPTEVAHEPPAMEAIAPAAAAGVGAAAALLEPKGAAGTEPPDPFSTASSPIDEQPATPLGFGDKTEPPPVETVVEADPPALIGLAFVSAVPKEDPVSPPAEKLESAPVSAPIEPSTPAVAVASEPPADPRAANLSAPEQGDDDSPFGLSNQAPPSTTASEPQILAENEPPVPVEADAPAPAPMVAPARDPVPVVSAPAVAAAAVTGAATAAATVAALDRDANSPPKKVTSTPKSDGASASMTAATPAPAIPATAATSTTAIQGDQPPQRVTSVPRSATANSIKLESPPAGSTAVASNTVPPQASITVPEPSDPTLFAPLERSRSGNNAARSRTASDSSVVGSKIDPITHVVARGENFWTISRHYYGSGRFYKALWRANAARVPRIDELYIGTSIRVPAPEDLDPRYIEPASGATGSEPRRSSGSGRISGSASTPAEASDSMSTAPRDGQTVRTGRESSVPASADPDDLFSSADELAASQRAASSRSGSKARPVSGDNGFDSDEAPVARKRTSGQSTDDLPPEADLTPKKRKARTHVVKQYETLRSIAKQELGDSRREDELLELNGDLIDDPTDLTVGTPLRLPAR